MAEKLTLSYENDILTASLFGELDHHSAVLVREKIDEALFQNRPQALIIHIGGVDFMDSSGLGLIMGRLAKAKELNIPLKVANPAPRAVRMLKMAGLQHLIMEEKN